MTVGQKVIACPQHCLQTDFGPLCIAAISAADSCSLEGRFLPLLLRYTQSASGFPGSMLTSPIKHAQKDHTVHTKSMEVTETYMHTRMSAHAHTKGN